ncbi:MAG TPA: DUF3052 domain-containing protein [Gemmatimonadaceae bacterium]|nr:DUF3052 domain-containing protein [Gemmatimonadaceae bacterium]
MTSSSPKKSAAGKTDAQAPRSFGYSGTPLVRKLGIKPGARLCFVAAPPQLPELLGALPDGAADAPRGTVDFALLFATRLAELTRHFPKLRDRLESNGMLWVSWPKKTSGVATDLNENVVRDFGLANGLVDVKVCAIDDTWSGLKFVRRLSDR